MSSTIIFIVAAVVLNVLIYGGVVAVFSAEERRGDPPRTAVRTDHDERLPASRVDTSPIGDDRAEAA